MLLSTALETQQKRHQETKRFRSMNRSPHQKIRNHDEDKTDRSTPLLKAGESAESDDRTMPEH